MESWQRKRSRLAGARLRATHDVAAREHHRNCLQLNWCRRLVTGGVYGAKQCFAQTKLIKSCHEMSQSFPQRGICSAADGLLAQGLHCNANYELARLLTSAGTRRSKIISRGRKQEIPGRRF